MVVHKHKLKSNALKQAHHSRKRGYEASVYKHKDKKHWAVSVTRK